MIDLADDDDYFPKDTVVDTTSFRLDAQGTLLVDVDFITDRFADEDDELGDYRPLITSYLDRHRMKLAAVLSRGRSTPPYIQSATIAAPTRNKSLSDLYNVGSGLRQLIEATDAGTLTRKAVVDLVLSGEARLLVGSAEGPWLDVKSQHYDLAHPAGRISLAEAVSTFCNAELGGVVVVGMDTKHQPGGGEVIKSVRPVPLATSTVRQYLQALRNHLVPYPQDLRIETTTTGDGEGLVVVSLPPQPEELKPFLVHGAVVNGKVQGAYISILRRSGDDSVRVTAAQIHSTLAAGRALLRRGQLP